MDNIKVSFIIPIYKEGNIIENINKIFEDEYPNELKEIILTVDVPTEKTLKDLKLLSNFKNVKIYISNERRGKVKAVNDAVKLATGDVLIFLDGDVEIKYINIRKILEELKDVDILSAYKSKKVNSFVGRFEYIEYLFYYDVEIPILSRTKKLIFLEGSGFVTKREVWEKLNGYRYVVIEDFDFGMRAYLNKYKCKMTYNFILELESLPSFKKLWDQRVRWYYGFLEAILNFGYKFLKYIIIHFYAFLPLIFTSPIIIFNIVFFIIPFSILYNQVFSIYEISSKFSIAVFLISPEVISNIILYTYGYILYMILLAIIIEIIAFIRKKKLLNIFDIFFFLIIYSEYNLIIAIYVILYYILFERPPKFNWKVS